MLSLPFEGYKKGDEVLDPHWTPAAGYAHATALMAAIAEQEQFKDDDNEEKDDAQRVRRST